MVGDYFSEVLIKLTHPDDFSNTLEKQV